MDILLVNPHLEFPSDTSGRSSLLRSKEYLLNMGLLSLATFLISKGITTRIIDLAIVDNPEEELKKEIIKHSPRFVGISNQSCHSYLSTKNYAEIIKSISADSKVIVGGLHASGLSELLLKECQYINYVVVGDGELVLLDLIKDTISSEYQKLEVREDQFVVFNQNYPNINDLPRLDYTIYPNFDIFVPYIEESRGCTFRCHYCTSPLVHKGIRIKDPESIKADVDDLKKIYGAENFHFFMEANNFAVNHTKTEKLAMLLKDNGLAWRTESRTDTFPIHLLDELVDSGLRVLDLGLESGSTEMLLAMNKTKNTELYLNRGIEIAKAVAKNGKCLLKLNVMLYYGENSKTVKETREYISRIAEITPIAIGAGPVRMDPGSINFQQVDEERISKFKGSFWSKVHTYPLDLSKEISFDEANQLCLEISREFQTSETYYESKRYSQLPYKMTYKEFIKESEAIPLKERPWKDYSKSFSSFQRSEKS